MARFSVILLVCLFATTTAMAREKLVFQQMAYGDWLIYDEDGEADGIFATLMRAIAAEANIDISFNNVPYKRTNIEVSEGKKVLTAYMITPPLDAEPFPNHRYLAAMLPAVEFGIAMRKGIDATTYKDIEGKRITFFRGASPVGGLNDNPAIDITLVNNFQQAWRMLMRNRVDGIWTDFITMEAEIAKQQQAGLLNDDPSGDRIFSRAGIPAIIVNKDFLDDPRVVAIQQAAERLNKAGILDQLARQWLVNKTD